MPPEPQTQYTDEARRAVFAGLTEGRIVHVRKPDVDHCIAAMVVRAWGGDYINALLFPDGANDGYAPSPDPKHGAVYALPWATSLRHDGSAAYVPGNPSWHWPERV